MNASDVTDTKARPRAAYIAVDDREYVPAPGTRRTFRKRLLDSDALEIATLKVAGPGSGEELGSCATPRLCYVLQGRALVESDAGPIAAAEGDLIVVPAGLAWGTQLCAETGELVMLEVAARAAASAAREDNGDGLRVVRPQDVAPYEPAGHAKTTNRCLFIDDHIEVIEGFIDVGGGAERHAHEGNEQALYVLSSPQPLLIHYPRTVEHGTGGGIADPLHLLVVYAPPLGESQNAVGRGEPWPPCTNR